MKTPFEEAMNSRNPHLIAEPAYIHEGSKDYLEKLIDKLESESAADSIKHHITVNLDNWMTQEHPDYNLLTDFLFDREEWIDILQKAKDKGLDNIVLVDEKESIDFAKDNIDLIDAVELHAVALNNIKMLEKLQNISAPIIIGIGGSELEDIEFALDYLDRNDILLMHGFQNYPTKHEYIDFNRMETAEERFNLPVGYADHTSWQSQFKELFPLAGFMKGANIIEKHVALNPGERRTDYEAAVGIESLSQIRRNMMILEETNGDGTFEIPEYEQIYSEKGPMKYTIVADHKISKGKELTEENITFRRTKDENTIEQKDYRDLIGEKVSEEIRENEHINWNKVK